MPLVAVCRDLEAAAVLIGGGAPVVLCCTDGGALGDAVATLRAAGSPPAHRLAALVGDLTDPDVEGAALAMARELFGGEPVVVPNIASLQGWKQAPSDTV